MISLELKYNLVRFIFVKFSSFWILLREEINVKASYLINYAKSKNIQKNFSIWKSVEIGLWISLCLWIMDLYGFSVEMLFALILILIIHSYHNSANYWFSNIYSQWHLILNTRECCLKATIHTSQGYSKNQYLIICAAATIVGQL